MADSTDLDALVLDVDTRGSLAVVRSLGARGYAIAAGARDGGVSGLRTRYAQRRVVVPDPTDDLDAAADGIVAALRAEAADTVMATVDESLAALVRRRDELERLTAPALAAPEPLEVARSKARTLDVARSLGIAVPRAVVVDSPQEILAAVDEIGLPAVLKPVASWRDVGAGGERVAPVYLADLGAARAEAARYVRPDAPALVQELAPGRRETVKLFRAGGRFLARLAMEVARCWPPLGGSSVMRSTIAPPADTLAAAERLVAEIGLDGYSEVEFRRDARGRPLLMEVNPRLSQSAEVALRAGIDFGAMQLEWARGGRIPAASRYAVGLRVGWLAGDLRLVAAAVRRSGPPPTPPLGATLAAVARDYTVGRARLEGLDARDPAPIVGALAFTARSVTRRGTRRPSR